MTPFWNLLKGETDTAGRTTSATARCTRSEGERLVPLVLGAAGHRGIQAGDPRLLAAVEEELDRVRRRAPSSNWIVLSALAEGADRLVARLAMERLDARLIVPLPMPTEEYQRDFGTPASRAEFAELLGAASASFALPVPPGEDPAADAGARSRAYARAGAYIAEHSQVLLAVWDGAPARGLGGTADVVRWAEAGRPPPEFSSLAPPAPELAAPEPSLVIRVSPDGRAAERRPANAAARAEAEATLSSVDRFNEEALRLCAAAGGAPDCGAGADTLLRDGEDAGDAPAFDPAVRRLAAVYGTANALALRNRDGTRDHTAALYLAFAAAVLALGAVDLSPWSILAYLGLLAVWALLRWWKRWSRVEDRFLDQRALAEGLRVAVFWRLGGVAARVSDNYLTKHRGLLAWIRRAVRNVELSADPGSEFRPLPRGRDGLVRRLWIERQQAYFAERGPANGRRAAWLDRFAHWSLVCSITVGVLYALCLVSGCLASGAADVAEVLCLSQSDPHNLFQAGIGLSLAMGAALQAWSAKRAYGELARHYRLAGDLFALAASELDAGAPPTRVFLALGRWALAENGEWLWTHRNLDDEAPR